MSDTTTVDAPVAVAPVITRPTMPAWLGNGMSSANAGDKPKSILIYAKHGTRKTSLSGDIINVPGFNRVLHIDIDNGTEVLFRRPDIAPHIWHPEKNPTGTYFIQSIRSLEANAKAKLDAIIDDITTTDYGYDAVILDTLDVSQDVAEKVFEGQFATSGKGGKRDGFAVYGALGIWTDEIVRKLHESPFFTAIITAHEKENTSEEGVVTVTPRLSGSSKDAIGGIPSIVAHLAWVANPSDPEDMRLLATVGEHDRYITKNRFDLPRQILDFNLPSLYKQIEAPTKPATAATN
jgi:hypothetical protein